MVAKSKISQGIKNLQNNLGFTRDEAIKISCDNITKSFQKNLIPALIELQERFRYSSAISIICITRRMNAEADGIKVLKIQHHKI